MLEHDLTMKADELFTAGEIRTDGSGEDAQGLYLRDTRFLSRFSLSMGGEKIDTRLIVEATPTRAEILRTNRAFTSNGRVVPSHSVVIREVATLGTDLTVEYDIRSYLTTFFNASLVVTLAADFRDIFDIRGFVRSERGSINEPDFGDSTFTLNYVAQDGIEESTRVTFNVPALFEQFRESHQLHDGSTVEMVGVQATIDLDLSPGGNGRVTVVVSPKPSGREIAQHDHASSNEPRIITGDELLTSVVDQGLKDLNTLQTSFADGSMPAAGIPWFVAPFGRDSLIVGLQTYHLFPERAEQTLSILARLQGQQIDPETEEEPGKILHEMRYGEMARLHVVPHRPYYGTVDATPLFIWLAGEVIAWTGNRELFTKYRPHVLRAVDWIERFGDIDGDQLVEYSTVTNAAGSISHKVWKDSWDSLHDRHGKPGNGLIAAIEVQGYLFAGYAKFAEVAAHFDDVALAEELREKAEHVRAIVEARFWMEDEGCYAQALDSDKRITDAVSSNSAHLLATGLPSHERAARVGERFSLPDLMTRWGVRTLSSKMATYNPMSYHNGSIWPHDNSMIAAGMYRYGRSDAGSRITLALCRAASRATASKAIEMPELYCGFETAHQPVPYPVSCSPQAWASGALPLIVRAMAGLKTDLATAALIVDPQLPEWINRLEITNLRPLGQMGSITIERNDAKIDSYSITSQQLTIRRAGE